MTPIGQEFVPVDREPCVLWGLVYPIVHRVRVGQSGFFQGKTFILGNEPEEVSRYNDAP